MPAARYWRVVGISTYGGGDLELSDIALYSGGTRVDGSATFTSTFAPISAGRWAAADVRQPGFALQWDFGVAQDVDAVGMRGPSRAAFPYTLVAQYSTDAILWYDLTVYHRTKWYDASTFTVFSQEEYLRMVNTDLLLDYDLSVGARTSLPDRSIYNRTVGFHTGGASYSTQTGGVFGNRLAMTGQAGPIATITSSTPARYAGYTIESWFGTSSTAQQGLLYAAESLLATSLSVGLNTNRNLVLATRASSVNQQSVSTVVAPFNQWFHLAVVIVGSEFRVYLNGQLAITHNDTRNVLNSNASSWEFQLGLGGALTTYANLVGSADETRLYRAALYSADFATQTAPYSVLPPFDAAPSPRPSVAAPPTRISAYTPPPTVTAKTTSPTRLDLSDYGPVTLVGTVKVKGTPDNAPLRRRVRLYDEIGRRLIRETWSDASTGAFTFENLPQGRFTAMTYDHENIYRALVIDNLMEVVV